jgi:hypothetical protein
MTLDQLHRWLTHHWHRDTRRHNWLNWIVVCLVEIKQGGLVLWDFGAVGAVPGAGGPVAVSVVWRPVGLAAR